MSSAVSSDIEKHNLDDHHSDSDMEEHDHHLDPRTGLPIPKAMQIYEPWMEPDYYKKNKKSKPQQMQVERHSLVEDQGAKRTPTPQPISEAKPKSEPEPVPKPKSALRPKKESSGRESDWTDNDLQEYISWVTNGRMDDLADAEKKLFKK